MPDFKVNSAYQPIADQIGAREGLALGIGDGDRFQTLLGVTGSVRIIGQPPGTIH